MTASLTDGDAGAAVLAGPEAKAPYAAHISPNMGLLKVREQVKLSEIGPDLHSFVIHIPASASVQAGFDVFVRGFSLNSISRKVLLPDGDPAGSPRGELVRKLREARLEKARLEGLQQALNTRMSLWVNQPDKNYDSLPAAKDLEAIDASLAARIPEIHAELSELPEKLRQADQLVQHLQNELSALGGENPQLAEITVTVTGRAAPGQQAVAEYSYFSYNCGWYPSYSFDADPIKGTIVFKQQANIRQSSGKDWNGVELSLSTKALDFRLQPNPLGVWNLRREEPERDTRMAKSAAPVMEMSAMEMDDAGAANYAPRQQPVSLELGAHREWKIGKVNLSGRTPAGIELERRDWKGDFYYTLRPSREEAAYLTAKVNLDEAVELAPGEAIFVVDGRLAGYLNNFRAGGKELELFFGKDDMISVEAQDLVSMRGQERFILKTNTYNWHWKFIVKNMRSRAVQVRVEDPIPQVRDASIKLKVESSPKAGEDFRAYFWENTIPAGGEFVIEHKVEARASGSERIIPGR